MRPLLTWGAKAKHLPQPAELGLLMLVEGLVVELAAAHAARLLQGLGAVNRAARYGTFHLAIELGGCIGVTAEAKHVCSSMSALWHSSPLTMHSTSVTSLAVEQAMPSVHCPMEHTACMASFLSSPQRSVLLTLPACWVISHGARSLPHCVIPQA